MYTFQCLFLQKSSMTNNKNEGQNKKVTFRTILQQQQKEGGIMTSKQFIFIVNFFETTYRTTLLILDNEYFVFLKVSMA